MAFKVDAEAVKTNVVDKLAGLKEEMETVLDRLETEVDDIPNYMEGNSATAYVNEFDTIIESIYTKLDDNVGVFADKIGKAIMQFQAVDEGIGDGMNA